VSGRRGRRSGGRAAPVGAVLPRVLARLGLAEDLDRWRAVNDWSAIAGDGLARYTHAVRVEGDVLVVEADNSSVLYEISHRKKDLLDRVRAHLTVGRIADVRFVLRRT
jgi:predicted nucleic acid-binding Zn ribbon protein